MVIFVKPRQAVCVSLLQGKACLMSVRWFQDVREQNEVCGAFDARGTPIGEGCRLGLETAVLGFPDKAFENITEALHAPEPSADQLALKREWISARQSKKEIGILNCRFPNPSNAGTHQRRQMKIYTECAFLSTTELRRLLAGLPAGN